jgi:3-oxoacyl-[acyl-carrier protein] reductase
MEINFKNKLVLVTASSQGIGFGIAKGFLEAGAKVGICSRTESKVKDAEKNLAELDASRIFAMSGDISQLDFLRTFKESVEDYFNGSIDILINNSGGPPAGETIEFNEEAWKQAIDSNLLSVIRLSSLVIPGMKKKQWGRIINLTSTTAREPAANMALSNTTRAAVAAYSKTLSHELGPFGITVNTVLTGGCMTERFYSLASKQIEQTGETLEDAVERMKHNVPVRYISTPDQFAKMVLLIASEHSGYLTGTAIPLDGGTSKSIF